MSGITCRENELFEKWQESRNGFVRDGVVSEKEFLESDLKIVFVLKEVNDSSRGGWDLREFLYKGGRKQTWDNVARWVHGIRNQNEQQDWEFYSVITEELRTKILRSICAINLKKSPGSHTTDRASFDTVVKEDVPMIRAQYSLYNADLTICGGTGDWFQWLMGDNAEWKKTKRGIRWYERDKGKYVVSFTHPEARVQDAILMYSLLDAWQEIRQ